MPDDVTNLSTTELAARIRDRELSPVEVTRAFLERIARIDPHIGSFWTVTADLALVAAAEAERDVLDGKPLGALHGVPIGIKDLSETKGVLTTFGSRLLADYVPEQDANVVARLFDAGAILLGKTATPEFGLNATTEFTHFPPTRNPWNLEHSAGGSSGGSAAALAARLVPFAEGSDGGGSIRIPSAACGVVGLKPARGRISTGPLVGEAWSGLATTGPMARTVADVALGLDVMAGAAVGDPYPTVLPAKSFLSAAGENPGRLRIGWTSTTSATTVHPEVAAAIERTRDMLSDQGHELVESAPDTSGMWETLLTIVAAHTAARPIADVELLGPHARVTYEAGLALSASEFLQAETALYQQSKRALSWFEEHDLLLCPVLPTPPVRLGELSGAGIEVWDKLERYIPFTFWVNMTGQPAMSLPLAQSADGLPIGVQLVGRQLAERTLISVAAALEAAMPWSASMPAIATE
jgi:amidase